MNVNIVEKTFEKLCELEKHDEVHHIQQTHIQSREDKDDKLKELRHECQYCGENVQAPG